MRRLPPQLGLVQVTVFSRVFWRHLQGQQGWGIQVREGVQGNGGQMGFGGVRDKEGGICVTHRKFWWTAGSQRTM
jgi:hypothetical protein